MIVGEHPKLIRLSHRALVFLADDLADDSRRTEISHTRKVDGGLGVAGPTEHSALLGPQRYDVARSGEVVCARVRIGKKPHRRSTVRRRDSGSDSLSCIDSDGVRGAVLVLVGGKHGRQSETVAIFA